MKQPLAIEEDESAEKLLPEGGGDSWMVWVEECCGDGKLTVRIKREQ